MENLTPLTIVNFSKDIQEPVSYVERTNPITQEQTTFGRVRVEQEAEVVLGSLIVTRKRVAYVTLDEKRIAKYQDRLTVGAPFPIQGKIVVKESFEPQYEGHKPKMNPSTKEYITVDNKTVYMQQLFTNKMDEEDVLLK